MPEFLNPETLKLLLSPSDLVILGILFIFTILGLCRGLIRTVLGFCTGIVATVAAGFAAGFAAPVMAQHLVLPIIGNVLQDQATKILQGAGGNGLSSVSDLLRGLLDIGALQQASAPIQEAAMKAAQRMAESFSYSLLFFIFLIAFSAILKMVSKTLRLIKHITPLSFLDGLAGGAAGLASGLILVMLILWVLTHFSPALFTELGVLSPTRLNQTLLTQNLLKFITSASIGA